MWILIWRYRELRHMYPVPGNLSALQTRTDIYAISVDQDDQVYNKPSHKDFPVCHVLNLQL